MRARNASQRTSPSCQVAQAEGRNAARLDALESRQSRGLFPKCFPGRASGPGFHPPQSGVTFGGAISFRRLLMRKTVLTALTAAALLSGGMLADRAEAMTLAAPSALGVADSS